LAKIALYRKYRSVDFDDLYGQDHITRTLKNSVAEGTFAHAYLFYGPRGTGKTSAARILARAINCEHNVKGNPDNTCDKCKLINSGATVDIIEIDAASHTQVDNIREVIIERAKFAPTNLKYKVYIIDEAHMLSKSSFNALLKTLEEPPEHTVFILATTEINKIIPTIQSRCQRFDFHRINEKALSARLSYIAEKEKIKIEDRALELIVRASEGGFRDAISMLDQVADMSKGTVTVSDMEALLGVSDFSLVEDYVFAVVKKETNKALEILGQALENGYEPAQFLKNVVEVLRRLALASVTGISEIGLSEASEKLYSELLQNVTPAQVVTLIDSYIKNDSLYKYSGLFQLSLEVATVKACIGYAEVATGNASVSTSTKATANKKPDVAPTINTMNLDDRGKWQHLLLEIKGTNSSIHAVLKVCEPEFADDLVTLAFPYKFHKERIEDVRNRQVVEENLVKVYGKKYRVKCILRQSLSQKSVITPRDSGGDDLLDEAINIFGGEVLE
jgi:DNA polymerase III subunit gamma/tau